MTNDIGVSTRTMSKDIASLHYNGSSHSGTTLDFITNYGDRAGVESLPAKPFTWKNHSGMQTWESLMDHTDITPYPVADGDIYKTVLRGPWKAPKIDRLMGSNYNEEFLFNPGDPSDRMHGWLDATINKGISYVEIPEFRELIVARHERQPDPVLRKFVTDILVYDGPNNETGKRFSEIENLRQSLDNYSQSKEKVGDTSDIQYLGVISIDGVIYAINRLPNGGVVLYTGTEAYELLSQEADLTRVSVEDKRTAALGAEPMHHARKDYDKRTSTIEQLVEVETAAKLALLDHYERLAEGSESDPRLREKYMKIVKSIEQDIATVDERYRQLWKQTHDDNEVGDLELVLMAEAYANGYEGKAADQYVARKLKEQGKEGKIKNSSLERTVEDNDSETKNYSAKTEYDETGTENEAEDSKNNGPDNADAVESDGGNCEECAEAEAA